MPQHISGFSTSRRGRTQAKESGRDWKISARVGFTRRVKSWKNFAAGMKYRVRLSERALRDLEEIYVRIEGASSNQAHAWFNGIEAAIYSLERFPNRGAPAPEKRNVHHLLYGRKPDVYRILYVIDGKARTVEVLHIRHGARKPLSSGKKR